MVNKKMRSQAYKSKQSKNILSTLTIAISIVLGFIVYDHGMITAKASAIDRAEYVNNCVNLSGVYTVPSISEACGLCYDSASGNKVPRGAMWFNDGLQGADSNVVQVADGGAQSTVISLWGRMWSCGGTSETVVGRKSVGRYIWFGEQGQYTTDSKGNLIGAVDFIAPNTAQPSLFRGSWPQNGGGQWTIEPTPETYALDIPKFKEYAKAHGGYIPATGGNRLETYRAYVSVNRCANTTLGMYKNTTGSKDQTCYGDDSEIILMIPPTDEEEEPEPVGVKGIFSSQSFGKAEVEAKTVDGASERIELKPTSKIDGKLENKDASVVTIDRYAGGAGLAVTSVGIDQETIDLEFWHKLFYNLDPPDAFEDDDTVPAASTEWTVTTEVKTSGKRTKENKHPSDSSWTTIFTASDIYTVEDSKKATSKEPIPDQPIKVTVDLGKGQTTLVCSTIEYKPKTVYFSSRKRGVYKKMNGTDSDYSQACIAVFRPTEPEGTPWSGDEGGEVSARPMYAGEETPIGWNVWTSGSITNRIAGFQATNYVIPPNADKDSELLKGTAGLLNDPSGRRGKIVTKICEFYAPIRGSLSGLCNPNVPYPSEGEKTETDFDSDGNEYTYFHELNASVNIVSPNEVGRKHANTAGYYIEIWRCVPTEGGGCKWTPFPKEHYWDIYNSAVRTIAKKPSTAFWNGSLFTGSNVMASLATRYRVGNENGKNAVYTAVEEVKDTKTYFGSWSEYLAVVGQGIQGFTSGTVLSGGFTENFDILENSPLTIANKTDNASELGHSGLSNDLILRQRLQDYFFSNNNTLNGDIEVLTDLPASTEDIDKTYIISKTGDLKIDHDIKLKNDAHDSIYTLPQVLIYASGNIKIGPDVEQIDAWLIAGGTLDTCDVFAEGETSAKINEASDGKEKCFKSLTINGPVFAKNVKLNRTYGADGISNEDKDLVSTDSDTRAATAEVFNLSADSYLWAYAQSGRYDSSYSEVYSRELPPRY